MLKLPDSSEARRSREFFTANGYTAAGLVDAVEIARPPTEAELAPLLHLTREPGARNTLIRLFLLGAEVNDQHLAESLPDWFVEQCIALGILTRATEGVEASIVVVPVGELLVASDAFVLLGTEKAPGFVLPASTHAGQFLANLTMRTKAGRTLDLGTGCGLHALLAAAHSDVVVATDISRRALQYCEFNARLNGIDNIRCVEGSLFEPVADQRFDLIVSNPPFVPGPGGAFEYRDAAMELDEFCAELTRQAPEHLNDGGHLQMLCEWVEVDGEPWRERIAGWVRDSGCDTWLLRSRPLGAAAYAAQRSGDVRGRAVPATNPADWIRYFDERNVTAVHPGMLVLRRRPVPNWFAIRELPGDVTKPAGDAVARALAAADFVSERVDDAALGDAVVRLNNDIRLEQHFDRDNNEWRPLRALLTLDDGLAQQMEVDAPVLALLQQFDGRGTIAATLQRFADAAGADAKALTEQALPLVRTLIERGYLEPAHL